MKTNLDLNLLEPEHSNYRLAIFHDELTSLSSIYQENINMSVWKRAINDELAAATQHIAKIYPFLKLATVVSIKNCDKIVRSEIGDSKLLEPLVKDMTRLVDSFCSLFNLKETELKLTVITEVTCPRFHVDMVPCRLISTYIGRATEWLPHEYVDRSKLGAGNRGKPDNKSGLFKSPSNIQHLNKGYVAILKGESWNSNNGGGLVHRSPEASKKTSRLVITLDFPSVYRQ